MGMINEATDRPAKPTGEFTDGNEAAFIPASLEAYIATRTENPGQTVAKLVQQYADTALWTVIDAPIEAELNIAPCRIGASLMLRRSNGTVSAAIVSQNWSITLKGDEAWIDVGATAALALSYIGKQIRTVFQIPFLSADLEICGATPVGNFYRFHCRAVVGSNPMQA